MNHKIVFLFLPLLLFHPASTQFVQTLEPINRCLGNCASCPYDNLETCDECAEGYGG